METLVHPKALAQHVSAACSCHTVHPVCMMHSQPGLACAKLWAKLHALSKMPCLEGVTLPLPHSLALHGMPPVTNARHTTVLPTLFCSCRADYAWLFICFPLHLFVASHIAPVQVGAMANAWHAIAGGRRPKKRGHIQPLSWPDSHITDRCS